MATLTNRLPTALDLIGPRERLHARPAHDDPGAPSVLEAILIELDSARRSLREAQKLADREGDAGRPVHHELTIRLIAIDDLVKALTER